MSGQSAVALDQSAEKRYTNVAIVLHWLIALGVFALVGVAWYMVGIPKGAPERAFWFNLHKSIGTTVGVLVLIRIWWRLNHKPPVLPASMPAWEVTAAKISHALLYACLIVMPLTGFIASQFTKYGVKYFGLFSIGPFFEENKPLRDSIQQIHEITSYVIVTLVVIHIAAALKHLLVDKDGVFQRMHPNK
jgi:cytochrome b561